MKRTIQKMQLQDGQMPWNKIVGIVDNNELGTDWQDKVSIAVSLLISVKNFRTLCLSFKKCEMDVLASLPWPSKDLN